MSERDDAASPAPEDLTRFLNALGRERDEPKPEGSEGWMPFVYEELRAIAQAHLRGADPARTLQPTMLVHSAYLKLFREERVAWNDRRHFFVVAAKAMRQVVVDHARHRGRRKRNEGRAPATLDEGLAAAARAEVNLLDLDQALAELAELDPRQAKVVELRFFAGLEMEEVARVLEVSTTTVERDWRFARAWLGQRLEPPAP